MKLPTNRVSVRKAGRHTVVREHRRRGPGNVAEEIPAHRTSELNLELERSNALLRVTIDELQLRSAELERSRDQFRSIFENIHDMFVRVDTNSIILMASPSVRHFGYEPLELVGVSAASLYQDPEQRRRVLEMLKNTGAVNDLELILRKPDGTTGIVSATAWVRHDQEGVAIGLDWILRDMTERKRLETERQELEQRLFQADKLETIGRLSAGLAHDFNTVLTIVVANSELLELQVDATKRSRHHVRRILEAAQRGSDLTRQLISFSRRQSLRRISLDLNILVRQEIELLDVVMGDGIDIKLELASKAIVVHADPHQISRVIMNIAMNAKHAMGDLGVLSLTVREVDVDVDVDAGKGGGSSSGRRLAALSIRDNGSGMENQVLERIFEPYFTTKSTDQGTGLGLSVAFGIVQEHEGWLRVTSVIGEGSEITVYLPIS